MKEILQTIHNVDPSAKYQINYVDYEKNQYTIPLHLNEDRINHFINDGSVREVKITMSNKTIVIVRL